MLMKPPCFKQQHGVALIEILIAILVTAIGILGVVNLQVVSLKTAQNATLQAQANTLGYDMLDRLRANPNLAKAGAYNLDKNAATPTGNTIQDIDRRAWREMIDANLPPAADGAKASIACNPAGICTITIPWSENNKNSTPADNDRSITLVTQL